MAKNLFSAKKLRRKYRVRREIKMQKTRANVVMPINRFALSIAAVSGKSRLNCRIKLAIMKRVRANIAINSLQVLRA